MTPVTKLGVAALGLVLALGACSPGKDDGPAAPLRTDITEGEGNAGLAALNLAEPSQLSWASRSYDDGVFSYEDLVYTPADADTPDFTIDRLLVSAPRLDDGAVAFDSLEVLGFAGEDEDAVVRVDRLLVDQPGPGLSAFVADLLTGRAADEAYQAGFTEMLDYSFGGLAIEGVTVTDKADEAPGTLTLAELSLAGFDGEALDRLYLRGMVFAGTDEEPNPVRLSLGEVDVLALNGSILQAAMGAGGDGDAAMAGLSEWMLPVGLYDSFIMRTLELNAGGAEISIAELTAEMTEEDGRVRLRSAMPSLLIGADPALPVGAQLQAGLNLLGYDSLTLSMASEAEFDPEADRLTTTGENYLQIGDGMRVVFEQDLSGLKAYAERYAEVATQLGTPGAGDKLADDETGMMTAMMRAYEPLLINRLTVRFEDQSLLERVLTAAAAAQTGGTVEGVRSQFIGMIGLGVMMAPPALQPLVMGASGALTSFVQQGGTLVIAIEPTDPVSVATLMSDMEAGRLDDEALGISVRHEAPTP